MSNSEHLGWLMQEARNVREAYQRGEITFDERMDRIKQLTQPQGFWARVRWYIIQI